VIPILRATRASSYERRAEIAIQADERQDDVIASVLRSGFRINWSKVERETAGADDPLTAIRREIWSQLVSPEFRETVQALDVNGRLIAAYIQQQNERAVGMRLSPIITFAEASVFTPARAVAYWQKKLGLDDRTAAELLANLSRGESPLFGMRERIAKSVMERIAKLFEQAIAEGISPAAFPKKLREIPTPAGWSGGLEDVTDAVIETEYRTNLTEVYSEAAHEQVLARKNTFPFLQFMAIRDARVTWWCCGAMGTAVNGRGWICATDDVLPATKWRLPAHWKCRSCWSPISYLEAQRLGILAKDGRTRIAIVGGNPDRPFGDPPATATNPQTGEMRDVEPQAGFGS
jgi:hypothetical protein